MQADDLDIPVLVGQLVVGGFHGPTLPNGWRSDLARGHRGGVILFRHNVPSIAAAHNLCRAVAQATHRDFPPFLGVDEEGGRVTRLPSPFPTLPSMRRLASTGDADLVERAAHVVGTALAAIGFNVDFAPVLDVDTNPANPIIGDRSFGSDAETVSRMATRFIRGLQRAGVMASGKHFPGHGDTDLDSHLALPIVRHGRERLESVEIPPFRAAVAAEVATMMTAHVVYEALDAGVPATLSHLIATDLLRGKLGFTGPLFSDDLGMQAVAAHRPVEESAVQSITAGCDVLLVCKDDGAQQRAHEALIREAESSPAFRARCREAFLRGMAARRRYPLRPAVSPEALNAAIEGPDARTLLTILSSIPERRPPTQG